MSPPLLCLLLPVPALWSYPTPSGVLRQHVPLIEDVCSRFLALPNLQLLCLQEYYTSGFLSIQAAIDGYVLGLNAETETSLGPFPVPRASAQNVTSRLRPQPAQQELFTEWGEQSLWKALHEHTAMVA